MANKRRVQSKHRKSYKNLRMWVAADELVVEVYELSQDFPREEMYGLTSQLRRAALSVALNIVEGYGRRSDGDLKRFLDIALASLAETEYLIELGYKLGYMNKVDFEALEQKRELCGKLVWSYRKKVGT